MIVKMNMWGTRKWILRLRNDSVDEAYSRQLTSLSFSGPYRLKSG